MKSDLITYLESKTGVTDAVSTRIYSGAAPKDTTRPFLVITEVVTVPSRHLTAADGYARSTYQIDCWGTTYASAKAVADAVYNALSDFRGTIGTKADCVSYMVAEREDDFPPSGGSQVTDYRVSQDYRIIHPKTVPTNT